MVPQQQRAVLLGLGGVVCIIGTLLPWIGTDGSARTSYELASIVDRLGLSDGSAAALLIRVWPAVPVAVALCSVLAAVRCDRTARLIGALSGSIVILGCVIAWTAPLPARAGVALSLVGSVVLLVGGLLPRRVLR